MPHQSAELANLPVAVSSAVKDRVSEVEQATTPAHFESELGKLEIYLSALQHAQLLSPTFIDNVKSKLSAAWPARWSEIVRGIE